MGNIEIREKSKYFILSNKHQGSLIKNTVFCIISTCKEHFKKASYDGSISKSMLISSLSASLPKEARGEVFVKYKVWSQRACAKMLSSILKKKMILANLEGMRIFCKSITINLTSDTMV